jgi:phage virion morphogenesis protein
MANLGFNINPALKPLWDSVKDKKTIYAALTSVALNAVEKNFDTEGERLGKKWEDLKSSTIKAREKKNLWPGKILQARGKLAQSVQGYPTNEFAAWGTNLKYAKTHALGLTINYPERNSVLNFRRLTRGIGKGKVRFAKEKKATFAQQVLIGAHSVSFPVRNPFLLAKEDYTEMNNVLTRLLLKK